MSLPIILVTLLAAALTSSPDLDITQREGQKGHPEGWNGREGAFKDGKTLEHQTDGVLKCISDRDVKLSVNKVSAFCGNASRQSLGCYSSYHSFKLCLINNGCQNEYDQPEIPLACWNCWANMVTISPIMADYQVLIESCSLRALHLTASLLMLLLLFLLAP